MGFKDSWFDAYVERLDELEGEGIHPELAEEMAVQQAHQIVCDRLADIADNARDRAKYEGL